MKRMFAYYCPYCDEIFEYKQRLERELSCPSCTNRLVLPLHRIIFNRQEVKDENNPKGIRVVVHSLECSRSSRFAGKSGCSCKEIPGQVGNRPEDAESGIPKEVSDISGVRCPENEPGTRLRSGIDLLRK